MNRRLIWLDCAKAFAMLLVIFDHSSHLLFIGQDLLNFSYSALSIFVVLSGISTAMAYSEKLDFKSHLMRLKILIIEYAIASLIYHVVIYRQFNLNIYFGSLLAFDVITAFYYFFVLFQLVLISPYLLRWFNANKKHRVLFCVGSLVLAFILSIIFFKYTMMIPLYGAGSFLLGASFFFLFCLGIVLVKLDVFKLMNKNRYVIFIISLTATIIWFNIETNEMFIELFGYGINPPGVEIIVFTMLILPCLYTGFTIIEKLPIKVILKPISFIGRNTLYIYMYHILVRDFLQSVVLEHTNEPIILFIVICLPMMIIPSSVSVLKKRIKKLKLT